MLWPQFGPFGDLQQHGFARNVTWALDEEASSVGDAAGDQVSAVFTLGMRKLMKCSSHSSFFSVS